MPTTEAIDAEKFDCQTVSRAQGLGLQVREPVVFTEVIFGEYSHSLLIP